MSYNIENILICLAAPFLLAAVGCDRAARKNYIFIVMGFLCCTVAAYLNTFFMMLYRADSTSAVMEITPVVEETTKLLPLLFYLAVFEADAQAGGKAVLNLAIGFASFENICYLIENGTDTLFPLIIRGFSTGAMHIACAFVMSYGLRLFQKTSFVRVAGLFGLLCVNITFHAIFNMLMRAGGTAQLVGYALPVSVVALLLVARAHVKKQLTLRS